MRKLLLLLICSSAFGATVTNMIVSPNGKVQTFNGSSPFGSREIVHTVGGNPVTITATTVLLNTTLYWVDGAPYVASPTGGVELVSFALPDLSVTEPTNSYPAAFAAFSPTVTNTTPHADAPQIAEWTRQNDPGDTMALTAEGVDGAAGGRGSFSGHLVRWSMARFSPMTDVRLRLRSLTLCQQTTHI